MASEMTRPSTSTRPGSVTDPIGLISRPPGPSDRAGGSVRLGGGAGGSDRPGGGLGGASAAGGGGGGPAGPLVGVNLGRAVRGAAVRRGRRGSGDLDQRAGLVSSFGLARLQLEIG